MEFLLLGPLEIRTGRQPVPVPSGKQRALLAALLLKAGRVVSAAELADVLWADEPPASARPTLHNYVKRVRQLLGDTGHRRIVTRPAGYQVVLGPGELDLASFQSLCERAGRAAGEQAWERAAALFRESLSLWRGEPLADVPSRLLTERSVPRLAALRLQALESCLEADLRLGRHAAVIAEARELAAAHPLQEGFCAQLMLALYRDGRQAEALTAFAAARQALVTELGIEPGPRLQDLHRRILAADSGLLAATSAAPAGPGRPAPRTPSQRPALVPRQLPALVPHFVGRESELAALREWAGHGEGAEGPRLAAISGTAGVGKTALAVRFAHTVAASFPDGQLHVNLRGFGPSSTPMSPAEAIAGFLDALSVPPGAVPAGLTAQAALYRSLLAGRRVLVVLDNVHDCEQVRPLLPGTPGCLVVVTSRTVLTGLAAVDGACLLRLSPLSGDEARELLARRLGAARAATDPVAVAALATACGRLPLALAVTAARAAAQPGFPLAVLAAQLRDRDRRLDALGTGDEASDVRTAFSWSYRQLTPPAARMFRLLALHPGSDISVRAAACLANLPDMVATVLLGELTSAHLLAEASPGRFTCHDLLRVYAAECTRGDDSQAVRDAAIHRLLDHYLYTSHAASLLLNPGREPLALGSAPPEARPALLTGHKQAREWFTAEQAVLLLAVQHAARSGFSRHAWQLPWAAEPFLAGRGRWQEYASLQRTGLGAAERLRDCAGQADAHRGLGYALLHLSQFEDAHRHYRAALGLSGGDRTRRAAAHVGIGMVFEQQQQYRPALTHTELALELYQQLGNRRRQARALNNAGWCHVQLREYARAVTCCQASLTLHRGLGDTWGEAAALDSLGYAHHHLGEHQLAVRCYQQALAIFRDLGYQAHVALVLARLGDSSQASGDRGSAGRAWREAVAILSELRHPETDAVRSKLVAADPAAY